MYDEIRSVASLPVAFSKSFEILVRSVGRLTSTAASTPKCALKK